MIPTAKEFLEGDHENAPWTGSVEDALREFARLHVKEALDKANNQIDIIYKRDKSDHVPFISEAQITDAYPLSNIK